MSTTRVRIDPDDPASFPTGRVDPAVVDGTTEAEIAMHQRQDETAALQDMARYARRVRRKLGLTQSELATRIAVSHATIRNWEQGKTISVRRGTDLVAASGCSPGSDIARIEVIWLSCVARDIYSKYYLIE